MTLGLLLAGVLAGGYFTIFGHHLSTVLFGVGIWLFCLWIGNRKLPDSSGVSWYSYGHAGYCKTSRPFPWEWIFGLLGLISGWWLFETALYRKEPWLSVLGFFGMSAAWVWFDFWWSLRFSERNFSRYEKYKIIVLVLVSTFFLYHRLMVWPNWLHNDGAMSLKAALGFLEGKFKTFYFTEWGDNPALPFLFYATAFAIGGVKLWTAALVPATLMLVSIFFYYRFFQRFFSPTGAWLAGLLLASSRWIVFYVRTPREVSLLPAFEGFALYCFARAAESGRFQYFFGFSVSLALCLQTYVASRTLIAVFMVVCVWLFLTHEEIRKRQWKHWCSAWAGFTLLISPLMMWYFEHPWVLTNRLREINVFSVAEHLKNPGLVKENIWATLRMYGVEGMRDPHFNLPGVPMVAPIFDSLMWVGLAWCFAHLRQAGAFFCASGFCLTLLTTLLAHPGGHPMRSVVHVPFVFMAAAFGWEAIHRILRKDGLKTCWKFFVLAAAWYAVFWNAKIYFKDMPASRDLWAACEGHHLLLAQTLAGYPPGWEIHVQKDYYYNHEQVLTYGRNKLKIFHPIEHLENPGDRGMPRVIALEHALAVGWNPWIERLYPKARRKVLQDPWGRDLFDLYEIEPETQTSKTLDVPRSVQLRIDDQTYLLPALYAWWEFLPEKKQDRYLLTFTMKGGTDWALRFRGKVSIYREGKLWRSEAAQGSLLHWEGKTVHQESWEIVYEPDGDVFFMNLYERKKDDTDWKPLTFDTGG